VARDGKEMMRHLRALRNDPALARAIAQSGERRVRERHTCVHRVDELFNILGRIGAMPTEAAK
jgi:spore maturation protein CgeB